jgi:hypothetical protein
MAQTAVGASQSRVDVLVVDDWAMAPLQETERRDFWDICEERYQTRSTILTSQIPVAQWHEQIGDATIADGILDAWCTTRIASNCAANRCANPAARSPSPHLRPRPDSSVALIQRQGLKRRPCLCTSSRLPTRTTALLTTDPSSPHPAQPPLRSGFFT